MSIVQSGIYNAVCPECGANNKGIFKGRVVRYTEPVSVREFIPYVLSLGRMFKNRFRCTDCHCVFDQKEDQ